MEDDLLVPEIHLTDPEVLRDPFDRVRQRSRAFAGGADRSPPGFGRCGPSLRHDAARAMLGDPRFELNAGSYHAP